MAKAKRRAKSTRSRSVPRPQDAIALLKSDHRQVEAWFAQFESTRSDERKQKLALQCCQALKVHTQIEEEIFYPAFLEATEEEDIHHEAEVEHDGAKKLIAEIEASQPDDDYYGAKVKVLAEMIKHHVNEEERRDGMFAKARKSDMDLQTLGEQLAARKTALMGEESEEEEPGSMRSGGSRTRTRSSGLISRLAKRVRGE
jgi:hemerythrin HHE cation binding domain-containing protein